jgi:hypothetical protein
MPEALVITPVKDSLETTIKTVKSVHKAHGDFSYILYNDFSTVETKQYLEKNKGTFNFDLINLEDLTTNPSPNYKMVLQMAQKLAIDMKIPLIIIESDVIIKEDTISNLIAICNKNKNTGMVGAITVNEKGNYNFPYDYVKSKSDHVVSTNHSLSFCCTLLSYELITNFNFNELSSKKDWFDIFISRQSKKLGYENFLAKNNEVLHLPHSSRPWKQLKYTNPIKYYLNKYLKKRDRI